MTFIDPDRQAQHEAAVRAVQTVSDLFWAGELPFYPTEPISERRLRELAALTEDRAVKGEDPIASLHNANRRKRKSLPVWSVGKVAPKELRRLRRAAAKELESLA